MMFNLMTVSCQTFSLGHILIDYVFGAAIPIAHGDHNDGDEDSCDDVRRAAKSGDYCVAKTTSPIKTFASYLTRSVICNDATIIVQGWRRRQSC